MLLVEKVDLKSLFGPTCRDYCIPFANAKGWADIGSRAQMMRRFQAAERAGKQPVLLACNDFDPAGLLITNNLRENLADLSGAVGWSPDRLIIDRFGLNRDFIDAHQLPWIDGLQTSSGESLADPAHPHNSHEHVQRYLREHGARKVESNALVVRADAARALLLTTIHKYLSPDAPRAYQRSLTAVRTELAEAIRARLAGEDSE